MPKRATLFPFQLTDEVLAKGIRSLAKAIMAESDAQVEEKKLVTREAAEEYRMACDGLGCWRMKLRFQEELDTETLDAETEQTFKNLCDLVAEKREYNPDDFLSVLFATCERARLPWGFTSLRLAYGRARRRPIRILKPELKDAELPAAILNIALELSAMRDTRSEPVFIPVDSLRSMMAVRKLVIGGAIQRLIAAGLLEQTTKKYGTGRAREFRVRAEEGKDFEYVNQPSEESEATE